MREEFDTHTRKAEKLRVGRDVAPIAEILRRWPADRLFQAAELIEELETNPGFNLLAALIEEARDNAQDRLIAGPTLSQADYARAMGLLAGLDVTRKIPRTIREIAAAKEKRLEAAEETPAAGGS
jgi:hypothetical protein